MRHNSLNIAVILLLIIAMLGCDITKSPANLTSYVNPFIGTGGHGHTYPGASMPFGMVQLSPDTRLEGWDGCGGYHYSDSILYGFSHTHLSGTGIPDYGDVLLMPTSGKIQFDNGYKTSPDLGYASKFSHNKEKASPGFYEVELLDYNINAKLTATPRAGLHQYTFNKKGQSNIILDLDHRDKLLDVELAVVDKSTVQGKRISKAWAEEQHIYFYAQFSKEFLLDSIYEHSVNAERKATKAAFVFATAPGESVLLKVGISAVSIAGAKANLESEIPHWDFDKIKKQANDSWEEKLHKIEVQSDNEEKKTIFYTALYHSLLNPNLFMDVDGKYRGMDNKVHTAKDYRHYSVFSLWDTFRAEHPLFTIIEQERTNDFINTFLDQYQKGGVLPIWELAGNYTGCMIGYHAIPVIADAYAKGIDGYDVNLAFDAMKHSALQDHLGLDALKSNGYIPADHEPESVSKTLEYAYDDWCIASMAKSLGQQDDYEYYLKRGQNYKNIFDPSTGFMRAKMNSTWFSPFDPSEVNYNYTEANSWQYSLFVPQDVSGMIKLYGSNAAFENKLDELFETSSFLSGREQADITGLIGQYAHGNEPSHHMAYLYNFIGRPDKTQQRVAEVLNTMYHNAPDGLSGNEDCGQMSAWYVLSAMGIYPVTPGMPYYTIGTPIFDEVTINLENGKSFVIKANNLSDSNYLIQSVGLNGTDYKKSFISHSDIIKGGKLEFDMGATANKNWFSERPHTAIEENLIVPVPYFDAESKTFTDKLEIKLGCVDPSAAIYYSLDGDNQFVKYNEPFEINQSAEIWAYAEKDGGESFKTKAEYFKIEGGRSIELKSEYANQYAAGGDNALIDYLRGGDNYRTGSWQGYQGQDLIAVVDLGKVKTINEITIGFLQDIKSWIWFPRKVNIEVSIDGKGFTALQEIDNDFPDNEYGAFTQDFTVKKRTNARYVRVTATNYGECPEWHLGYGGKSWLFADEIVIK